MSSPLQVRFQLDWRDAAAEAVAAVTDAMTQGGSAWTGAQKRRYAVRRVSVVLDEAVTWGKGPLGRALEFVDGPVVFLVATALVEGAVAGVARVGRP